MNFYYTEIDGGIWIKWAISKSLLLGNLTFAYPPSKTIRIAGNSIHSIAGFKTVPAFKAPLVRWDCIHGWTKGSLEIAQR